MTERLPYCNGCLSSFLTEESLAGHQCQPVEKVTCCHCGIVQHRVVDICICDHDMRYCCKRTPCPSCGLPVPVYECYPWPGHKADCALLKQRLKPFRDDEKFTKLCGELGIAHEVFTSARSCHKLPEFTTQIEIGQSTLHFDVDSGKFLGVESNENCGFEPKEG